MKLSEQTTLFEFHDIPMAGNLDNGALIGLTPAGRDICARMLHGEVADHEVSSVDPSLLDCLKSGGFVEAPPSSSKLKSAYLHVTQRCNLRCIGCYSLDETRSNAVDAPLEHVLKAVAELARGGISNLVISGGEPLLRNDLPKIAQFAKDECSIPFIDILTNGTLVDKTSISALRGLASRVSVSFDGYADDQPSFIRGKQRFSQLSKAIGTIHDCGISTHIIVTIHSQNIDELEEYSNLAKRLGATINFSLLSCPENTSGAGNLTPNEHDLERLALNMVEFDRAAKVSVSDAPLSSSLRVRKNCGAGVRTVSVTADGSVYPCHLLHIDALKMGNLFEDSIETVLQSTVSRDFSCIDVSALKHCSSCQVRQFCGGGCRARSLFSFGSLTEKDPYCSLMTTFYNQIGYLLSRSLDQS